MRGCWLRTKPYLHAAADVQLYWAPGTQADVLHMDTGPGSLVDAGKPSEASAEGLQLPWLSAEDGAGRCGSHDAWCSTRLQVLWQWACVQVRG
jgi:hypothetical protein